MTHKNSIPRPTLLTATQVAKVRALVDENKTGRVATQLGVSVHALTRAVAGLPARHGTIALIAAGLARLEDGK